MLPSFNKMETPLAVAIINATPTMLSAPLIKSATNFDSFMRKTIPISMEETTNKVDISNSHQSSLITPKIIIQKVKPKMVNNKLVLPEERVEEVSEAIFTSEGSLPSIL